MSSERHREARAPAGTKSDGAEASAQSLNDIAYARIKDDIISCALQPGGEVSEGCSLPVTA